MSKAGIAASQPWYGSLDRRQWNTLVAANLGWMFDGYETYALLLTVGAALHQLLAPAQFAQILAYSLMTGLSAFAWDWMSFAALRLLVGVAIGSEWATGTSITAELWPDKARGKGAGLMQCGLGIGFFVASLVWLFVGTLGADGWRYMFLLGILPGFFTLWIRRGIPESPRWEQANLRR